MNQCSDCPCPPLDIDQVRAGVQLFNYFESNLKPDAALHEIFQPPLSASRLALCAFALDGLWYAGITRRQYQDWSDVYNGFLHRIAHFQRLAEEIRSHPLPVLDAELDQKVISPRARLLENLLGLVQRNYYVFATKFMHWWVGTPPIDGRAAAAIGLLCNGLQTGAGVPRPQRIDRFQNLLRVYNCWLNELGPNRILDLQQYDYKTQNPWPHLQCWNSPVRILDKFLWIRGGRWIVP